MSDRVMTYEYWLRGCVHHDGRNGYVTLPCDEVLKIADFIEKLRADRKTKPLDKDINVRSKTMRDCYNCERYENDCECIECHYEPKIEPQTCNDCDQQRCETCVTEIGKTESQANADKPQWDSVSRRYLLAEIDDLADEFSEVDENGLHSERWCGISDAKCVIVNAPDLSDRPEGEWIIERKNQGGYTPGGNAMKSCSNCGWIYGASRIIPNYRFCPMCGADMRGEDND